MPHVLLPALSWRTWPALSLQQEGAASPTDAVSTQQGWETKGSGFPQPGPPGGQPSWHGSSALAGMQVTHRGPPGKAYKEEPTQTEESQEQKGRGESHPEPGMCPGQVHRNSIIPDPPPVTPVSVTCYPGEVQPSLCLRQPPSLESDENPCSDSLACQKAPHHSPQGRD